MCVVKIKLFYNMKVCHFLFDEKNYLILNKILVHSSSV